MFKHEDPIESCTLKGTYPDGTAFEFAFNAETLTFTAADGKMFKHDYDNASGEDILRQLGRKGGFLRKGQRLPFPPDESFHPDNPDRASKAALHASQAETQTRKSVRNT